MTRTRTRTRTLAALSAAVLALTLTGCGETAPDEPGQAPVVVGDGMYVKTVDLPDGREVTCVVYAGYKAGGLSCDWDGAR